MKNTEDEKHVIQVKPKQDEKLSEYADYHETTVTEMVRCAIERYTEWEDQTFLFTENKEEK